MIHNILTHPSVGFISATQEPCIYYSKINGEHIFLLCQVDDFAVAASNANTDSTLFDMIQKEIKQPLKLIGILVIMLNGPDVTQGNKYINLSCNIYLTKILQGHWYLCPNPLFTIGDIKEPQENYT